jgi:glyoxylase-like metal-dependent hydrolase (beta-lactamase superfamily II)
MRLFMRITMGLSLAVVLAAAAFLMPQHLQTRGVAPALPTAAQLRELLSVENGPVRIRYLDTSSQQSRDIRLGHTVFLVEWGNGEWFMIDAGMDRQAAADFSELMGTVMGAEPAEIHGSNAELLGDDIQRVQGVGFTHLHIDHSQGVIPFCEARGQGARVYQTGWQANLHNFNTEEGAAIVAQSCLQPGELSGDSILTAEPFPGLGMVGLGGHTPGSTLFAVASQGRVWLFSGDTSNSRAELLDNTGKGWFYSTLLVPENTRRLEALRRWLADLDAEDDMRVIVSHDLTDVEASGLAEYRR